MIRERLFFQSVLYLCILVIFVSFCSNLYPLILSVIFVSAVLCLSLPYFLFPTYLGLSSYTAEFYYLVLLFSFPSSVSLYLSMTRLIQMHEGVFNLGGHLETSLKWTRLILGLV